MIIGHYQALKPALNSIFYSPRTKLFYSNPNYSKLPKDYIFIDEDTMRAIVKKNKKQAR